eukprot:9533444-Alexandrium_andersonii.AAC.1
MGNWTARGECENVFQHWGFRAGRAEDDPDEPLFTMLPPPFVPAINKVQFCSYPSEAIEGN